MRSPQDASSAEVVLEMGTGELVVRGGDTDLMDGLVTSNVDAWTPRLSYIVDQGTGHLRCVQDDSSLLPFGDTRNEWEIELARDLPMQVHASLGAGESEIDLRRVDVRGVNIELGVGEVLVNLARAWTHSLDVHIDVGIGEVRVKLPQSVGVEVKVDTGLGDVQVHGLQQRDGHHYVNSAFGESPVTLSIYVDLGIGEVRMDPADEIVPEPALYTVDV